MSAIFAAATLGLSATLMPGLGIKVCGIGMLAGNGLVAVIALVQLGQKGRVFRVAGRDAWNALWRRKGGQDA